VIKLAKQLLLKLIDAMGYAVLKKGDLQHVLKGYQASAGLESESRCRHEQSLPIDAPIAHVLVNREMSRLHKLRDIAGQALNGLLTLLKGRHGDFAPLPMVVATDQLYPGDFDRLLGSSSEISKVGLFKQNRNIDYWLYNAAGDLIHHSTSRMNNVGLLSPRDYRLDREAGEFRICVIGDEQTASTLDEISWPDLLEDYLNEDYAFLERMNALKCKVFNFGWPDSGFPVWEKVYFEKVRSLQPDLVVLNFVSHSFERLIQGRPATLGGRPPVGHAVEYKVGEGREDTAYLWVACSGTVEHSRAPSLRNPNCVCGTSFQVYVPRALGHDKQKMQHLRQMLFEDLKCIPKGQRVELTSQPPDAVDKSRLVIAAYKYLKRIREAQPNLMITRNFWRREVFETKKPDDLTEMLISVAPELEIVLMQDRLPSTLHEEQLEFWYLPHDGSKWSSAGHKAYAVLIGDVVKERCVSIDALERCS
jgi:hypothetical protein